MNFILIDVNGSRWEKHSFLIKMKILLFFNNGLLSLRFPFRTKKFPLPPEKSIPKLNLRLNKNIKQQPTFHYVVLTKELKNKMFESIYMKIYNYDTHFTLKNAHLISFILSLMVHPHFINYKKHWKRWINDNNFIMTNFTTRKRNETNQKIIKKKRNWRKTLLNPKRFFLQVSGGC